MFFFFLHSFPALTEFGPLANPRVCVFEDHHALQYKWQVLFMTVASGEYSFDAVQPYLEQLQPLSGYKLCPGIREYPEEIRFQTKNLREWGQPFQRMDSQWCALWHVPNNVRYPAGNKLRDTCQACRRLSHDIDQLVERARGLSKGQRLARTSVQSNYPMKYLSPNSRLMRVDRVTKERKNLAAKLSAVAHFDFDVNDKQHAELLLIVQSVSQTGSKVVEELCARGDQILGQEVNPLREVWHQDVTERVKYEKDQLQSGVFTYVMVNVICCFNFFFSMFSVFWPRKQMECHHC